MSYEQLWAPWRLSYIVTTDEKKLSDCFLCGYRDATTDAENLVVIRGTRTITVLNRFPYNNGHLLVAPLEHKASLEELSDDEMLECMQQMKRLVAVLEKVLNPHGFNIGLNLGRVAGAGVPGHMHWHIVPRWHGDTNFMSVISDTTVIPQSLEELYKLLESELGHSDGSHSSLDGE